jgi:hypothetical protein
LYASELKFVGTNLAASSTEPGRARLARVDATADQITCVN